MADQEQKERHTLVMRTASGWYPIESSGTKSLAEEAADHGELNKHITQVTTIAGEVLWSRH